MAKTLLVTALLLVFAIGATSTVAEELTTKAPAIQTTTEAPTTQITIEAPTTQITIEAPTTQTTIEAPTTQTTIEAPTTQTTIEAPTTQTTTEGGSTTTKNPPTGSPATTDSGATKPPTTATQVPTTTEFPNACASNPCGSGSTCEPRADKTFVCLCLAGDDYSTESNSCQKAKVFPGQLALTTPFEPTMTDKHSKEFKKISDEIIKQTDKTFKEGTLGSQYSSCLVLELRKAPGTRASSESGGKVEASMNYFFKASAEVTEEAVVKEIKKAAECTDCVLKDSSFVSKMLCDSNPCDKNTTNCISKDGSFSCSCAEGFIPTGFTDRICLACPSGFKAENSKCTQCSFGYTGFNCEDSQLLGVVIAASVLGGLLLIAIIVMPIVAVKMKKKGSKKNTYEDIGKPYMSHSVAKIPAANSSVPNGMSSSSRGPAGGVAAPAGIPRIPRATGGSNWNNRTNLEMVPSNSHQNLISPGRNGWINDDQDDTFKFGQSRPQTNQYEQNRPQKNPYGQSSSVNPYAQRQGNSNPYFMSDDDRYSR